MKKSELIKENEELKKKYLAEYFVSEMMQKKFEKQSMHIQRQQNIIRRHKAELTNLHKENRRKKEVINNLIGEKMQLNKEVSILKNKYPGIGWDYEIV